MCVYVYVYMYVGILTCVYVCTIFFAFITAILMFMLIFRFTSMFRIHIYVQYFLPPRYFLYMYMSFAQLDVNVYVHVMCNMLHATCIDPVQTIPN